MDGYHVHDGLFLRAQMGIGFTNLASTTAGVKTTLGGGGLFLDVGANVGTYAIWAAECGSEVIALEPAADTFRLLLENGPAED